MSAEVAVLPISNGTSLINKYRLKSKIGNGSFGEVWLVDDLAVNHEYALKILPDEVSINQRLLEARVGHAFVHNNLVRVHQADVTSDGRVLIAMDFFPNGAVTTLANCANYLPLRTAMRVMTDVLQGLEHLHLHNFYHNDIKPQNILIGPQGQSKLSDYGIVGVSRNGEAVPPSNWYVLHAAPEMIAGQGIEAKTDVFQAGLTLYRLLVGLGVLEDKMNALGRDGYEKASRDGTLVTKGDFPEFVPQGLRKIVLTATHPDPLQRYQSALAMRRALERLAYPGHWTVDDTGRPYGEDARFLYTYDCQALGQGNSSLQCYRLSKSNNRQTCISRFTKKKASRQDVLKGAAAFIRDVVEGKI